MRNHGLLPAFEHDCKVLLIAGTHGTPPTQARFCRTRELAAELALRGVTVHLVFLVERPLRPIELDQVASLRQYCHELELVPHPENTSLLHKAWKRVRSLVHDRLGIGRPRLGGDRDCPRNLLRILHTDYVSRNYAAVLVTGVRLARCLSSFSRWTVKLLDLPRYGNAVHASHAEHGREDAFRAYARPDAEIRLMAEADMVIVRCRQDAVLLRNAGHAGDFVYLPLPVGVEYGNFELPGAQRSSPPRPPRILCVGSDTIANLDGLRWFRRRVFPKILQSMPTCRLRIVGEAARHIEPGAGIDQVGWVDHLEKEYQQAAIVALPLRMGSGVRRRAVEAIGARRVLATTTVGAYGLPLRPMKEAVISDDPAELAAGTVRALSMDRVRIEYEEAVAAMARIDMNSSRAMSSFCRVLGLPNEVNAGLLRAALKV